MNDVIHNSIWVLNSIGQALRVNRGHLVPNLTQDSCWSTWMLRTCLIKNTVSNHQVSRSLG
jgi:hypothetical protein